MYTKNHESAALRRLLPMYQLYAYTQSAYFTKPILCIHFVYCNTVALAIVFLVSYVNMYCMESSFSWHICTLSTLLNKINESLFRQLTHLKYIDTYEVAKELSLKGNPYVSLCVCVYFGRPH